MNAQSPIGPEDVLAMIRDSAARGFGRTPLSLPDPATPFRATPLAGLVRGIASEADAILLPEPDPAEVQALPQAPDPQALEAARAEGHAAGHAEGWREGHAAGLAEGNLAGRAEAQAALATARAAFEAAVARLASPAAADTARLAEAIDQAVRALAAQRAGLAIDDHPETFVARIEALADRVSQGLRQVALRLNPDDLAAMTPHLGTSELLAAARLQPDPRLARGDVEIRAEGIVLADLLGGSR
ncbi:FliH/SctL family protein [Rhodobacter sp. CZR27]|uniref:FliH/SctL family protein n=1 Tax=Rhodobacter sp. CZR27 TaxID=2033869 RepID=UPI000BBEA37B|nr:FliH/SctL family protein [Rhodobacter sp. CZR27]